MQDAPIDVLTNRVGSAYKLVVLAARRAIELGEGAIKLVDTPLETKITRVALKEIQEGKISYKIKDEKK